MKKIENKKELQILKLGNSVFNENQSLDVVAKENKIRINKLINLLKLYPGYYSKKYRNYKCKEILHTIFSCIIFAGNCLILLIVIMQADALFENGISAKTAIFLGVLVLIVFYFILSAIGQIFSSSVQRDTSYDRSPKECVKKISQIINANAKYASEGAVSIAKDTDLPGGELSRDGSKKGGLSKKLLGKD